jgi:hypothetical protein
MKDRFEQARQAVEDAVLRSPGQCDPSLRQGIASRREIPEDLSRLVEKIRTQAYKVTDDDFAALKAKYSDDQLFEIVLSASLGAAQTRLRSGLAALDGP